MRLLVLASGILLLTTLMPRATEPDQDSPTNLDPNRAERLAPIVWVKSKKEPVVEVAQPKAYEPDLGGAIRFDAAKWTQEIAVTNNRDRITQVPIVRLEAKWHGSGGLVGIKGWTSEKYKHIPTAATHWVGNINVLNSLGYYQPNRGIRRAYPDGTAFHDVLRNEAGIVFEHRVRTKENGAWDSKVIYQDRDARPVGYSGLKQTCASCHNEAGTGKYGVGLVPGGDTVLSDPLDWTVAGYRLWDWR